MNERGDPFAGLLLELEEQGRRVQPPGWCLGRVLEIGEGKLKILANGHVLDEEDLWVAPQLLAGYEKDVELKLELEAPESGKANLNIGGASVSTLIMVAGDIISSIPLYNLPGTLTGTVQGKVTLLTDRIQKDDWVVLLPDVNEEFYYVMTKVVKPHDPAAAD